VPLHRYLAQVEGLKEAGDEPGGGLADHDAPWPRQLLQSCGQVGRVAHRRVIHPQVVPDLADDDQPSVNADAHLDGQTALGLQLLTVFLQGALHPQCGVHGSPRAILMGNRRAEEGHDAIAGILVDGALEAMHLGRDVLETVIDDLVHDFRIEPFGERGEAGHIGEQDGHLPALPFQRAAGGQDLLGQVLWRVWLERLGTSGEGKGSWG
jgi:hypothetical protein